MKRDNILNKKVAAISLGCDKNRVDLEFMFGSIKENGLTLVQDVFDAEIIIVNTCAFIKSAIEEAIQNILAAVELKKGKCEKVIVTGCFNERFFEDLGTLFTEVDAFVKVADNCNIVKTIYSLYEIDFDGKIGFDKRVLTNAPHYAFLKIADGCDNACAYCTIPRIRGRYKSVPMPELIKQAKTLAEGGVKELVIVAQDVTRYGFDLYGEYKLIELLKELCKINGIEWIRLHYIYPELVDDKLLTFITENNKICNYLDIPLQHIDDDILHKMNRRIDEKQTISLVKNIKENYSDIAIRSTFIVGFPTENKKSIKKLIEFLKEYKLSNVGFFAYSKEERTKAYFLKGHLREFTKNRMLNKVQKVQYQVQNEHNLSRVGQVVKVLVDSFDEQTGFYIGRDEFNSILVDFVFEIVDNNSVEIGKFYNVKIVGYQNFTFKGEII